jgi:hypothetical protein
MSRQPRIPERGDKLANPRFRDRAHSELTENRYKMRFQDLLILANMSIMRTILPMKVIMSRRLISSVAIAASILGVWAGGTLAQTSRGSGSAQPKPPLKTQPRFKVEAVGVKALDESGPDWLGSDKIYAITQAAGSTMRTETLEGGRAVRIRAARRSLRLQSLFAHRHRARISLYLPHHPACGSSCAPHPAVRTREADLDSDA